MVTRKVDTRLPRVARPLLSIKSYGVQKTTTAQLRVFCSEKKKSGFDVIPGKGRGRKVSDGRRKGDEIWR